MNYLFRGGVIAGAGALGGLAIGFLLWGHDARAVGLKRQYADGERVRVARVVDGDTVVLEDGVHVRYRGCDTPETFRFVRDPEPFADEASERNRELVEGNWVRLRFPPPGMPSLDAHGRVLADVRLDGPDWIRTDTVAEQLIRDGLAKASSFELDRASAERMKRAQTEAKDAGRGMWTAARDHVLAGDDAPRRYIASRRGKMVHAESCEYAQRIAKYNRMIFNSVEAALATDRKPCPTCLGRRAGSAAARTGAGNDAAHKN